MTWMRRHNLNMSFLNELVLAVREIARYPLQMGKSTITLQGVFEAVVACAVVIALMLWFSAWLERRLLRRVDDLSLRKISANAVRAVLLGLGVVTTLAAVGVDLTALSVFGGALGVGLGFGFQKLAANYVSGFVILAERSLRIGDNVKVDGFEGRVTDITTRYTLIRALNGREAIIPNEKLITERVENLSLADRKLLVTTTVTVGYDSDVEQVRALMIEAALTSERVLREPAPDALLSAFAADGLEFTLAFWVADPENGQLNVKSDIHRALLARLRAAQIEIPYPQRVVRMLNA
jgi:small-conductance mechanosensitive channel